MEDDVSSLGGGGLSEIDELMLLRGKRDMMAAASSCADNCSGNGICVNGSCHCQIQFEGEECSTINFSYHVAFSSIFFLLALTSLIQLVMCVHAEYLRMRKHPSVLRACRVTTQKLLYFLVFLACVLRGAYFAAPSLSTEWSISLMSAYYPVVLTGASLIVCFWAEVFHLREVRWDRPRFLSKSFLGFLMFNVITYTLMVAQMVMVWATDYDEHREFYTHIFNGCYAALMFVVVVFFLIYGVEVFFKVRGGFTVPRVSSGVTISSTRTPIVKSAASNKPLLSEDAKAEHAQQSQDCTPKRSMRRPSNGVIFSNDNQEIHYVTQQRDPETPTKKHKASYDVAAADGNEGDDEEVFECADDDDGSRSHRQREPKQRVWNQQQQLQFRRPSVNSSQLHQSRVGLLSQAVMMMITVGFMFSETLEQFWKTKVDLSSRNTHDIIFRTVEIGVALWFPCVLWNCIRPEQLWCLNPKKILERMPPLNGRRKRAARARSEREGKSGFKEETEDKASPGSSEISTEDDEEDLRGPECWICYDPDASDAGPMINPCDCKGDVGAVHHDCLRRWLVESADNPDALNCKVCNARYMVEKGSQFSLAQGFTAKQWITTASIVSAVCLSMGGCWAVIQLYSEPWVKMLAVGAELLVVYISLRALGLNTLSAYHRAKVSALKIVNLKRNRGNNSGNGSVATVSGSGLESLRIVENASSRL